MVMWWNTADFSSEDDGGEDEDGVLRRREYDGCVGVSCSDDRRKRRDVDGYGGLVREEDWEVNEWGG